MSMMRALKQFYATPALPTEDERLAAAARTLAERRAAANAQDAVNIAEHIRRYHGGKLEPGESCPFLDKIRLAEADFATLDPKDADGDGNPDFPEEEEASEEIEEAGETAEDSAAEEYLAEVGGCR